MPSQILENLILTKQKAQMYDDQSNNENQEKEKMEYYNTIILKL
jgi:hypothetical protein